MAWHNPLASGTCIGGDHLVAESLTLFINMQIHSAEGHAGVPIAADQLRRDSGIILIDIYVPFMEPLCSIGSARY